MSSNSAWILLPVQIIFLINAGGHLLYALKLNGKYGKEHNLGNSIITVILWIIAGVLYPSYFLTFDSPYTPLFRQISFFFICIFTPLMVLLILAYQYIIVIQNDPKIKQKRNITQFLKEFEAHNIHVNNSTSHSLKNDIYRKILHIFPAAVILVLWIFAVYIWDGMWHADEFWGISGEQFGTFLIITAGYSGVLVFAALDYVRLSYIFEQRNLFHFLPDNVSELLSKSMKRNEIFEFTKSAAMVLAFTPIFFFPFGIFIAAALIATIGDGAASICGLKFGKKNFPKTSNKTIIGYIMGTLVSFLIAMVSLLIFTPTISLLKIVLIATGGALSFVLIDLTNLNLDDNILNPITSGIVMGLLYIFI
jgi:dolichol kinase